MAPTRASRGQNSSNNTDSPKVKDEQPQANPQAHKVKEILAGLANLIQGANGEPHAGVEALSPQEILTWMENFLQSATPAAAQQRAERSLLDRLRCFQPPALEGTEGPAALEEWLEELVGIFDFMELADAERIWCAVFQMREGARIWWDGYWEERTEEERDAMTWEGFAEVVKDKYYPRSYRKEMEKEFVDFSQGNRSVEEYERRFNYLCWFAPFPMDADERKSERFYDGLRPKIRHFLAGHGALPYAEMVMRAKAIEGSLERERASNKRKWSEGRGGNSRRGRNKGANNGISH